MNEKYYVPFIISICAFLLWNNLPAIIVLPMAVFIAIGVVLYAMTVFFTVKMVWRKIKCIPLFEGAFFQLLFINAVIDNAEKNNIVIPRAVSTGIIIMFAVEIVIIAVYIGFFTSMYEPKKLTDKPEAKLESTEGAGDGKEKA